MLSWFKSLFTGRQRAEAEIFRQLKQAGVELFGIEMVNASGKKLKMGSIYVHLARMEDARLIVSRSVPTHGGLTRRAYRLADQPLNMRIGTPEPRGVLSSAPQVARRVSSFSAAPSPTPAPDNTSDLMAGLMLASAMNDTPAPAPAPEPMRSGGSGDFGGGGAESSWSSPAPSPSSSYSSDSSSSSDSGSCSSGD